VVKTLGAAGLILPAELHIAPVLVPLAATDVGTIMVGAAAVTFRRRERKHALLSLIYLILAVLVAWGRFGSKSFRYFPARAGPQAHLHAACSSD
jgi:hypothetical protein